MSILDKFKKNAGGKRQTKNADADRAKFSAVGSAQASSDSVSLKPTKTGVHGFGDVDRALIGAVITEKATMLRTKNQYVFEVGPDVNKAMVRRVFLVYYGVRPEHVRVVSLPGKRVQFGRRQGVTKRRKKVIVTLPKGTSIEL